MNRSFRHAVALSLMLIGFAHAGTATPPEPLSIGHSVSLQLGLGPQDAALGADPEPFYGLRYEPTLAWSWPDPQWPRWQAFVRTWLNYTSSQTSLPFQEQQRREVEHGNAELREFYLRRPLLGDDP
ncbi:MAG TPA: ion channel protein AlgE, partial [Pseudomonas sp.]|nr:ion channel protein AlgE [Pseudomonas sp.]